MLTIGPPDVENAQKCLNADFFDTSEEAQDTWLIIYIVFLLAFCLL